MSEKVDRMIEELKTITLLETSELVEKVQETFGIEAPVNVGNNMMVMPEPTVNNGVTDEKEVEEKTEFNLVLEEFPPDKKISILKVVRSLTGLGLKEVKELVESAPKQIQENLTKEIAEDSKKQLEAVGAKVSLT